MKIYEFRKDLKKHFDAALQGQDVLIERGGVQYRLEAVGPVGSVGDLTGIVVDKIKQAPGLLMDRVSAGLCKVHDTPLDSRGKCLQKGCKYA